MKKEDNTPTKPRERLENISIFDVDRATTLLNDNYGTLAIDELTGVVGPTVTSQSVVFKEFAEPPYVAGGVAIAEGSLVSDVRPAIEEAILENAIKGHQPRADTLQGASGIILEPRYVDNINYIKVHGSGFTEDDLNDAWGELVADFQRNFL